MIQDCKKEKLEEAWRVAFEKVKEETLCVYDHHAGFVDGFHAAIDKACEWLEQVFIEYAGYYCAQEILDGFRKAMEE